MRREVAVWAVVDATGEIVGAYTNRLSAWRRVEYLDSWASQQPKAKGVAPFFVVRCVGMCDVKP